MFLFWLSLWALRPDPPMYAARPEKLTCGAGPDGRNGRVAAGRTGPVATRGIGPGGRHGRRETTVLGVGSARWHGVPDAEREGQRHVARRTGSGGTQRSARAPGRVRFV